ncbi:MAG: helix-turn-helix transcriptional regulator [Planctomycetales bacterium]|nr:helix-turn-helix transcriptional regulator [Planctomycetales bacterium]
MAIRYYEQLDRTFHALGDGTRRRMLAILSDRGECTASDLGEPFQISQPSVSKHIRVLEQAGLISRTVDGRVHRFQLNTAPLQEAQDWINLQRDSSVGMLDVIGQLFDTANCE